MNAATRMDRRDLMYIDMQIDLTAAITCNGAYWITTNNLRIEHLNGSQFTRVYVNGEEIIGKKITGIEIDMGRRKVLILKDQNSEDLISVSLSSIICYGFEVRLHEGWFERIAVKKSLYENTAFTTRLKDPTGAAIRKMDERMWIPDPPQQ